jgi:hypothetical protein
MITRYAGGVAALTLAAGAAGWVLRARMAPEVLRGGLLGLALAAAGAVAGLALTGWAFDKDQKRFFAALAIGMLGRLFVYGAALVYVALATSLDTTATALALLLFYMLFQVLELRFAVRGLRGEK